MTIKALLERLGHIAYFADKWPAQDVEEAINRVLEGLRSQLNWHPIETAPKTGTTDVELYAGEITPRYIGRYRYGDIGEPSPDVKAWRCSSSGRFAHPTHWKPLGPDPT